MMGKNKTSKGMYISFISAFLLIFLLNQTLQAQELSIEEIAERALPAVVQITTYDIAGARTGRGTGFFIEPGKILTCEHCVEDAYSAVVSHKDTMRAYKSYHSVTILKTGGLDLALLEVEASDQKFLNFEDTEEIKIGQKIATIGFAVGYLKSVTDGIISGVSKAGYEDDDIILDDVYRIQFSAPISPGNSGSPLLNTKGHVIGVASNSNLEGEDINFAVGIGNIRKFLEGPNNPTQLAAYGSNVRWKKAISQIGNIISKTFNAVFSAGEWTFSLLLKIASVIFAVGIVFVVIILTFKFSKKIFSFPKNTYLRKNPLQVLHGLTLLISTVSVVMVLVVYFSWTWLVLSLTFLPLAAVLTFVRYKKEHKNTNKTEETVPVSIGKG